MWRTSAVFQTLLFLISCSAWAQDMEPRAYSPSPVGTNFLVMGYGYSSGNVLLDPSLPLTDVEARLNAIVPGYARVFGLDGHAFSIGGAIPYVDGNIKGKVAGEPNQADRSGIGDTRLRFATNLLGGSALTREEFAKEKPDTVIGTSLTMVVPTGAYDAERLINIGSNRWAFKPEVGASHQMDNWFMESSLGTWLFTDNSKFFGDVGRRQDPIFVAQGHGGYTFMPGLWLAGDLVYYTGGETTVAGKHNSDLQSNSRYGVTLSLPLSSSLAIKIAGSKGYTTRIGGDFTTIGVAIQYRWFDD